MSYRVTFHAVRRFEERFPELAQARNFEEICKLVSAAADRGAHLRTNRDGSMYLLVQIGAENGVVAVRRQTVTTVMTDTQFVQMTRPTLQARLEATRC